MVTDMKKTTLVYLIHYIVVIKCTHIENDVMPENFAITPCSGLMSQLVQTADAVQQCQQRSALECAMACSKNLFCHQALFQEPIKRCLLLLESDNPSSQTPPDLDLTGCYLLRKGIPRVSCLNGGIAVDNTCQCLKNFRGTQCEEPNPLYCMSGTWKVTRNPETTSYPIKLVEKTKENDTIVYRQHYLTHNAVQVGLFDSLAVDQTTKRFYIPVRRQHKSFNRQTKTLTTELLSMKETRETKLTSDVEWLHLTREGIEDAVVRHHQNNFDAGTKLMNAISNGYRLITPEFTRLRFDTINKDAFYQIVKKEMVLYSRGYRNISWLLAWKSKSLNRYRIYVVNNKATRSLGQGTSNNHWCFDRCWARLESSEDDQELTNALKEQILMGKDVRLIIGGSFSIDVSMVIITKADVIVALADHLSPFGELKLGAYPRIRFLLLGVLSKTVYRCEMNFLARGVYSNKKINISTEPLEWFVYSRPSRMHLTVNANGERKGSLKSIYNAAIHGQDIRVCLEISDSQTMCFATTVVYAGADGHVTVQSQAVLNPVFDSRGEILKVPTCKRFVRLISTKGWVEQVAYIAGVDVPSDQVLPVNFVRLTWFA